MEHNLVSAPQGLKCTVVSLVPFEIIESKPGMTPSTFKLAACMNPKEPSILHVGTCYHYVYIDGERGYLQVRTAPDEVARSIVNDYVSGQLGVYPDVVPAIFYVHGELSVAQVKKECADQLEIAKFRQDRWFEELVKIADKYWTRYGNKIAICDFQRHAATALKLNPQQHQWMSDLVAESSVECPGCGILVKKGIAVCQTCKAILDPEKYKTLQFATV